MTIGQKLLDLRKSKQLSQEEVSYKLNVTRQTISKWETDQSTPDFDKIAPICELYGISADELFSDKKEEIKETTILNNNDNRGKRARGIVTSILLYFIATAWITVAIPVFTINPILASSIFIIMCGIATCIIVYNSIVYGKKRTKKEEYNNKILKQITGIIFFITLTAYLLISFITMAWYISWIIWIVGALIREIVKLLFMLKGVEDEK